MSCICQKHPNFIRYCTTGALYGLGQKWCAKCNAVFSHYGLYCECCGSKIRVRNRGRKAKKVYQRNFRGARS